MGSHTLALRRLADEVLSQSEATTLRAVLQKPPINLADLEQFDLSLGGPSLVRLDCHNTGRYHVDDRPVFRPLQYCSAYMENVEVEDEIKWVTREIVHMSGLHLESLLKRIGRVRRPWPLGKLLAEHSIQSRLSPLTRLRIDRFRNAYNAAKHDVDHAKDTHLFSTEDAVLAYIISRKIGMLLYPQARLRTDMAIFEQECP